MKLTSMIALAVKRTFESRLETWAALEEWKEERYRYCLNQAINSGDTNRYNKLLATHVPDC